MGGRRPQKWINVNELDDALEKFTYEHSSPPDLVFSIGCNRVLVNDHSRKKLIGFEKG